jgi:hypothetical protein
MKRENIFKIANSKNKEKLSSNHLIAGIIPVQ